jgi:hypothetical protein
MRKRTQKATQEAYFEAVDYTQQQLDRANIDFRIIGSLASHALITAAGGEPKPLRFQRPYAIEAVQALPDIDMIVPRSDLLRAREIREDLASSEVPVSLGLAASSSEIDFRPDQESSYLIHNSLSIPVDNRVLNSNEVLLNGVHIRTFPIDTQLHTYGTFGGVVRPKDLPTIRQLASTGNHKDHDDMQPFHDFMRQRQLNMTIGGTMIRVANQLADNSPKVIGNTIKVVGKRVASHKGLR